ncbi:saccharopine dehydrogenase family protein [Burkholderia alba]|uniref:saccharopine dehydrogenase family protein n=1 Tax=Burkholderia alba TaxID=2683677 RepID=UPI002B060B62|nr:saccharopine dehydrogenase NADP-binding domain-containing protein [Burkholderia alba]
MTAPLNWMIYGANGYTGEQIAREAVKRGLRPVLAGRSRDRIEPLAVELNLRWRVFGLDAAGPALDGVGLVMHCAGPFAATAAPMLDACLAARAHYLDITGEIAVLEHALAQHARARAAEVVVCPGVGFDVVPTDCVAAALKAALPDASHLALGFDSRSGPSAGTAKTIVEGLGLGGQVRREGRIVGVPQAWRTRRIDFGGGEKRAMTIPWGDVSTAFHSTGIPNIEVYLPVPGAMIAAAKAGNMMMWLWRRQAVIDALKKWVDRSVTGPDAAARAARPTWVWGEARNPAGQAKCARIGVANVYDLTVASALAVIGHLLHVRPPGGGYTPSRLMGADLVERLPGSGPLRIEDVR